MSRKTYPNSRFAADAISPSNNSHNHSIDKIPPLISIHSNKERSQNQLIALQSLNQSQVRSVYTVDREEADKQALQLLGNALRLPKEEAGDRSREKVVVITEQSNLQERSGRKPATVPESRVVQSGGAPAQAYSHWTYELFDSMVGESERAGPRQLEWIEEKTPGELLANVLTNESRMHLYTRYLLQEVHQNERNNEINELHQRDVLAYNPTLKQVYSFIMCLLDKLTKVGGGQGKASELAVSIFDSGVNIDLNPAQSRVKRNNHTKIRELKQELLEQEQQLQQIRLAYEEIISNYTTTIDNIHRQEESTPPSTSQTPRNSSPKADLEPVQPQSFIRLKNHTFGMRQVSNRSSKQ